MLIVKNPQLRVNAAEGLCRDINVLFDSFIRDDVLDPLVV